MSILAQYVLVSFIADLAFGSLRLAVKAWKDL